MRKKKKKNSVLRNLFNKRKLRKIETKINLLGLESKYDAESFLSIRVITSVLLFIILLFFLGVKMRRCKYFHFC